MQLLSIFDMDKTITRGPTWMRFLVHYAARHAPHRLALLPAAGIAALGHPVRLIRREQLKQATHGMLIGRRTPRARIDRAADSFALHLARRGLMADALARLAHDRAEGRRIVLATASPRFYVTAIARVLGVDDVIATEASEDGDRLLHRLAGDNCYGDAKLARIAAWLAEQGIDRADAHVRFYSDHVSDAPALGWADEGFAVNPDPRLQRLARQKGWPILRWR